MRMLASSVLVMESFVMGFALLLAMKDHSSSVLIIGGVIAIACLLAPGFLKNEIWLGSWVDSASSDDCLWFCSHINVSGGGYFLGVMDCGYSRGQKGRSSPRSPAGSRSSKCLIDCACEFRENLNPDQARWRSPWSCR